MNNCVAVGLPKTIVSAYKICVSSCSVIGFPPYNYKEKIKDEIDIFNIFPFSLVRRK